MLALSPVASARTPFTAGATYYAVGKRACKMPKRVGYAACYADIRVLVKKGTKGAKPFQPAGGATGSATIGPAGGLTPSDLASAYGLPTTGGAGQTVAIVDAYNDPNVNADLQTFDTQYGLPTCSTSNGCLTVVNQTGGTTLPASDTTGWSVEETLDVQAVRSTCQGCKIILVEANDSSNANLDIAENTAAGLAGIISNSFGGPESGSNSTDQAAFNHPGKVITASTGDDGYYSYDCYWSTCSPPSEPNAPASFSTVTAVGGTSLYLGQNGARQSESIWNDNGPRGYWAINLGGSLGAGGGGCSTLFSAPGWQSHLGVWGSTACGTGRLDADVSAVADYLTGIDIYDSYSSGGGTGWMTLGGTSLAAPVIAGVYGLAGGAQGFNNPARILYGHPGAAYDVTTGGNGFCDGEGAAQCGDPNTTLGFTADCAYPATGSTPSAGDRACDALSGYDGPSGWGTPNGLTAFKAPTGTVSGAGVVSPSSSGSWTAKLPDPFPGGTISGYVFNWGDGSANTTTSSATAAHTYTTGGVNRTISVTVNDNYGLVGTARYVVSVCCSANGAGTMTPSPTSVVHATTGHTVTFTYTPGAGGMSGGAVTLAVPAGWSAPSTTGTAPGYTTASAGTVSVASSTITVSGLSRGTSQPVTITYGSRAASGPGATSPSTAVGSQTWQAQEKSTSGGTLTNLASSPHLTVS